MKKVIALSWDKLFLSCSQLESRLATISYKTAILSSSFVKQIANGTTNSRWNSYMGKIGSTEKFSLEEIRERFDYLRNLSASGYNLVIFTVLDSQAVELIKELLIEQGFAIPVFAVSGNSPSTKLDISYDIYINYDWLKIMPVIVTAPDFYLVKSVIFLGICLSKVKRLWPTRSLQRA